MPPAGRSIHHPPALPPADFDPVNSPEDRARLAEFWLPSRPDPEREPELYEHWREMFSGPLRFVPAEPPRDEPTVPNRALDATVRVMGVPANFETSSNWSGAYILPNRGNRFTRIVGRWEVPEVRPGVGFEPAALPFRCSIWIGLDGKRRWTKSMPQVGTVHTVARDGTLETPKLWWQWWLRDGRSAPHDITGVPIRIGDVVLCSLTVVSPHQVRFHVKNRNTGDFAGLAVREPIPLRGSSAEWIVEQPAEPPIEPRVMVDGELDTGPLFPLPDYGSVLFERCAAQAAAVPGGDGRYHPLRVPRLIRMVQVVRQPTRSAVVSVPGRRSGGAGKFRVTYRAP